MAAKHALYICRSKGNPNDIPRPENKECGAPLENAGVHFVDNALAYYYKLPPLKPDTPSEQIKPNLKTEANNAEEQKPKVKEGHFATVEPGKNYALCGFDSSAPANPPKETKTDDGVKPYCMRFAVYTPFFNFPHQEPWKNRDGYTDPDPFVFIKDRKIAIFGVVEPNVALIQKRDLYDQEPTAEENKFDKTQDILDRFIWKGDLLTLIYVPGSTLKAALVQSEKFVNDEAAALLLVDEKGRQLEKLGIFSHPITKENMINEAPIDDKKLYAVATTDYIATGDTGYPMLAKEALNPRTYPAGFPNELHTISSVACRKLFPEGTADKHCLEPINRSKYLDESIATQVPPSPPPSRFKRFWHSSPFKWPAESEPATTSLALLEQEVQRRSIWTLSLRNASFGFSGVLSSRSDVELAEKFTGVSATSTSISTQETNTKTFLVDMVLSRTSHRREVFLSTLVDYKKTSTGDDAGARPNILQVNNRITFDAGYVHGLKGCRAPLRFGVIGTFHVEHHSRIPFHYSI